MESTGWDTKELAVQVEYILNFPDLLTDIVQLLIICLCSVWTCELGWGMFVGTSQELSDSRYMYSLLKESKENEKCLIFIQDLLKSKSMKTH